MAYADDYFDEHGYTDHGILLLIDMGNREWWISTKGYCIQAFSDDELASIGDEVADKLKDQTYMDAFETFLRRVDIVLYEYFGEQAEPVFGEMTFSDKFSRWAENISWSLVLAAEAFALILAFLIVGGMKRKMKTARKKALAQEYICENGFKLTRRADIYLYSHTSSRRIERENHPGRSSTHTGSSGKTHGGRGGRF